MTELFIVEADEMVVLMLYFFLHLFLSIVCLLLGLPHVRLTGIHCSYFILLYSSLYYITFNFQFYFSVFFSCCLTWSLHVNISVISTTPLSFTYIGNFKAVYQRARAHAALCNEEEARRDFDMVEKLDPKLKPFIRQELKKLGESMRTMHARQNKTYWDTTQEKWGPGGSKAKGAGRKKKFSQKPTEEKTEADTKTENSKIEHKENSEYPSSAETGRVDDVETEKNPDVKAEQCIKELESGRVSGEGLDNENM